jgi:hypothetical protein
MYPDDRQTDDSERMLEVSRQGWRCLGDDVVAAYLDGRLDDATRRKSQTHLADCDACRSLVADVAAMRRVEPSPLPLGLKERSFRAALPRKDKRVRMIPAFAAAGIACIALVVFWVQSPQKLDLAAKSPAPPMIAKSHMPSSQVRINSDVVRNLAQPTGAPTVLIPTENATVSPGQLRFSWKSTPGAEYYEIHVVTTEGEPVWEGESKASSLDLPASTVLSDGAYFVWIDAMVNGKLTKSGPVRFLVRTSQ